MHRTGLPKVPDLVLLCSDVLSAAGVRSQLSHGADPPGGGGNGRATLLTLEGVLERDLEGTVCTAHILPYRREMLRRRDPRASLSRATCRPCDRGEVPASGFSSAKSVSTSWVVVTVMLVLIHKRAGKPAAASATTT